MDKKNQCKQWLVWVNYRLQVLDEIEDKLYQMRELADLAQRSNLSQQQLATINKKFNLLKQEVNHLDKKSKNLTTH